MKSIFQYSKKYFCTKPNGILVKSLIEKWKPKFQESGIKDEEFFFKCILSKLMKVKFNTITNHDTIQLSTDQTKLFENFCECRMAGMPVQYIIGEWDFRDLVLKMVPPVFIPRPETEHFVEVILSTIDPSDAINFLEVGCGTGAISLSILKSLPNAKCVAIDKSNYATELANQNAVELGLKDRIEIFCYGISHDAELPKHFPNFDTIISNPPYVKTSDLGKIATELLYEDIQALDGGRDGLKVIRNICKMSTVYLKPNGTLWMEVDETHPKHIKSLIEDNFNDSLKLIEIYKDLFGKERFIEIMKKS